MTHARSFFTAACFFLSFVVYPQVTTVSVKLDKKEGIYDDIVIPGKGLLIKTGNVAMNTKDLNWKLSYYSPDLKLLWEVPLVKDQINKGLASKVIASEYTDYIYHLESKGYNALAGSNSYYVTQVDGNGKIKTTELENTKDYGYRVCTFLTKDHLIFLTTPESGNLRKGKQRLILNKISHRDFSYSKVELPLPLENPNRDESEWEVVDFTADRLYVVSKKIALVENKKDKTVKYSVYEFDMDGKELRKVNLVVSGDVFLCPSMNIRRDDGATHSNNGFDTALEDGKEKLRPTPSAYGSVQINKDDESLYVYGLTFAEPNPRYFSGYTIQKFDWSGKRLWKDDKSFGEDINASGYVKMTGHWQSNKAFGTDNSPSGNISSAYHVGSLSKVYFSKNKDKSVTLDVFIANRGFVQTYSADGNLMASESIGSDQKYSQNLKEAISRGDFKIKKLTASGTNLKAYLASQEEIIGTLYEFEKGYIIRQSKKDEGFALAYFTY